MWHSTVRIVPLWILYSVFYFLISCSYLIYTSCYCGAFSLFLPPFTYIYPTLQNKRVLCHCLSHCRWPPDSCLYHNIAYSLQVTQSSQCYWLSDKMKLLFVNILAFFFNFVGFSQFEGRVWVMSFTSTEYTIQHVLGLFTRTIFPPYYCSHVCWFLTKAREQKVKQINAFFNDDVNMQTYGLMCYILNLKWCFNMSCSSVVVNTVHILM